MQKSHEDRVCELRSLYEARIVELNARVEDLRSLVFSPVPTGEGNPILEEADKILTQNDMMLPANEDFSDEELRERDAIFSGEHENL